MIGSKYATTLTIITTTMTLESIQSYLTLIATYFR